MKRAAKEKSMTENNSQSSSSVRRVSVPVLVKDGKPCSSSESPEPSSIPDSKPNSTAALHSTTSSTSALPQHGNHFQHLASASSTTDAAGATSNSGAGAGAHSQTGHQHQHHHHHHHNAHQQHQQHHGGGSNTNQHQMLSQPPPLTPLSQLPQHQPIQDNSTNSTVGDSISMMDTDGADSAGGVDGGGGGGAVHHNTTHQMSGYGSPAVHSGGSSEVGGGGNGTPDCPSPMLLAPQNSSALPHHITAGLGGLGLGIGDYSRMTPPVHPMVTPPPPHHMVTPPHTPHNPQASMYYFPLQGRNW
ncbi:hypothetical protein FHG87_011140 [Trinorchestia longiramus]|nr:hypothetical protein FHG87_011140 [Trinorchestia longiramus]